MSHLRQTHQSNRKERRARPGKLLRRPAVLEITGLSNSQIKIAIAQGGFPRPVKIYEGGRAVGWLDYEIQDWLEQRVAARDAVVA